MNLTIRMYNLDDDAYLVSSQANPFDETTFKTLRLADQNFWFSFDVRAQANLDVLKANYDIFYEKSGNLKNEGQVIIDGTKMRKWVELNLHVVHKKDGQVTSMLIPFENCNSKYYDFLGPEEQVKFENRLCPREEDFKEFARV